MYWGLMNVGSEEGDQLRGVSQSTGDSGLVVNSAADPTSHSTLLRHFPLRPKLFGDRGTATCFILITSVVPMSTVRFSFIPELKSLIVGGHT